jgi:hypothetical protein
MTPCTNHLVGALVAALVCVLPAGACASKSKPASVPAAGVRSGGPAVAQPPATPPPAAKLAPPGPAAAVPSPAGAAPALAARPNPGPPPLTGSVTRADMETFNDVWKELRAQDYEPDAAAVTLIRDRAKDVEVFAVVATWCPDTRRDLPRFFKIADESGWSADRMKLLAVDRTKKDAGGLTEKWNVTRVPTFIFLRGGQEIGRVVEKPVTTLERDIAEIVSKR